MSQRDSVPDDLRLWRAAGVALDPDRQDACREAVTAAIKQAMGHAGRARARNRWLRGTAVAASVGLVAVGGWLATQHLEQSAVVARQIPRAEEAQAQVLSGTVELVRASKQHQLTSDSSMALASGDVVRVGTRSRLVVELPRSGRAEWSAETELEVEHVSLAQQGFTLRRGKVTVSIPRDALPRNLVVSTPHVDVVVVGTEFAVSVARDHGEAVTDVEVVRGTVELVRDEHTIKRLGAGETWSSRPRQATAPAAAEAPAKPKTSGRSTRPRPESSTLAEQNRLYRAALDARNAGRDEQTVSFLSQLLTKYPGSPLTQEAKVERFRALQRLGRKDEATRAARRYLAEHGDGFAREEARDAALPEKAKK